MLKLYAVRVRVAATGTKANNKDTTMEI